MDPVAGPVRVGPGAGRGAAGPPVRGAGPPAVALKSSPNQPASPAEAAIESAHSTAKGVSLR